MDADAKARGRRRTVVVVDDDENFRYVTRLVLEHDGAFRVVAEAADGRQAIEQARVHRPDLVLMDVKMPVMDGREALPLVLQASPGSRVVMLSGQDREATAPELLRLGAAGYLEKGSPLAALERELHVLLDGA